MKHIRMLVVGALCALLASCGTSPIGNAASSQTAIKPSSNGKVEKGMTESQVVSIMGRPRSSSEINGTLRLQYYSHDTGPGIAGIIPVAGVIVAGAKAAQNGGNVQQTMTTVVLKNGRVTTIDRMVHRNAMFNNPFS